MALDFFKCLVTGDDNDLMRRCPSPGRAAAACELHALSSIPSLPQCWLRARKLGNVNLDRNAMLILGLPETNVTVAKC